MRHARPGFTIIELLAVCAIIGVLTALSIPTLRGLQDTYAVQAATQQIGATLATARAAAVQKGRPARFRANGTRISAVVSTSAADSLFVVPSRNLATEFGVTVVLRTPGDSIVTFGTRGFRTAPRIATTQRYVVRRGAAADSVCIGMLGQILPRGCAL